jgi:hypothetical protein
MNWFGIKDMYTWKCYNETLCVAILNKQKCLLSKTKDRKVKQVLSGCRYSVMREEIRNGWRRVNMVEYYALMYENGEMRPVETVPGMGEDEGEWWRGWIWLRYNVSSFVNVTMYPQHNNNSIIKKFRKTRKVFVVHGSEDWEGSRRGDCTWWDHGAGGHHVVRGCI